MNIPVLTLLKMPEVALCRPWKRHGSVLSRVLSKLLMAWLSCGAVVCRWSLNGTLIDLRMDQRRVLSGGNLIIRDLDRDQDAGTYQCTAHNPHGAILSRRASLKFACKQWNAHPVPPHAHPVPPHTHPAPLHATLCSMQTRHTACCHFPLPTRGDRWCNWRPYSHCMGLWRVEKRISSAPCAGVIEFIPQGEYN